jgi:hypothetical protein
MITYSGETQLLTKFFNDTILTLFYMVHKKKREAEKIERSTRREEAEYVTLL